MGPKGKHLQDCMSSILPCFDFALLFLRLHWVAKREWNAHWMSKKPTESLERYKRNYKSQKIERFWVSSVQEIFIQVYRMVAKSKWVFVGSFLYVTIVCIKAKDICFLTVVQLSNGITTFCSSFNQSHDLYDLDFVHEFCFEYINKPMINDLCKSCSKMTHCNVCHLLVKACPWQNKEE